MRVLLMLLLAAALGSAQSPLPLSMKRAVEIALAPDGSTRAALAQESIQQAKDRKPRHAPRSSESGTQIRNIRQTTNLQAYGFSFKLPVPGFSIPSIVGPFSVSRRPRDGAAIGVQLQRRPQISSIQDQRCRREIDRDATRNSVSDEVARDYLACLRADADRENGARQRGTVRSAAEAGAARADAGTGTGIEVTRAEVQLANDRQNLIRAENDRNRATLHSLKAMGMRMDAPVEFTDKLEYKPIDIASDETLVEQARKARSGNEDAAAARGRGAAESERREGRTASFRRRIGRLRHHRHRRSVGAHPPTRWAFRCGCRYSTAARRERASEKASRNTARSRFARATWISKSNCRCERRWRVCARPRRKWIRRATA